MLTPLSVGPDVLTLLLPHRRPFLLIERVSAVALEPDPTLEGCRLVSANDPVFDGHFPGFSLLPGALVLEGLGQACAVLSAFTDHWHDVAALCAELNNLERALTLDPQHDPALAARTLAALRGEVRLGVLGAASLKFVRPIFAGSRLDYRVARTSRMGDASAFRVEARVNGEVAVRGTLTGSAVRPFPRPG